MKNHYESQNYIHLDLSKFAKTVLDKKFFITILTVLIAISSAILSLSIPNKYTSSLILKSSQEAGPSISGFSQFAGLSSLAGIDLPNSQNNSFFIVEKIKSKSFLKHLLSFQGVKQNLFAAKSFDSVNNTIIYDSKLFDSEKNSWVRKPEGNLLSEPSYLEINRDIIEKQFSVSVDPKTNFISLTFEHYSPVFAKNYLDLIVKELNKTASQEDLYKSTKALEYLNEELSRTQITETRKSINQLIENELKTIMLIKSDKNYLVTPIDQPHVPEFKSSPSRFFIVAISTIIGLLISILISLFRYSSN